MKRSESITTHEYTYTALFQPGPEGGFVVTCPSLPGLVTHGATLAQARAMATEAIELYLESLRQDGASLPASDPTTAPITEHISVNMLPV